MKLTLVPLLQTQRELYDLPLGWDRFKRYLWTMTGGSDDVSLLPLVAMNPMGKPHVAEVLDKLMAVGAEDAAAAAIVEAERRRSSFDLALKVGIVLGGAAWGGGWRPY